MDKKTTPETSNDLIALYIQECVDSIQALLREADTEPPTRLETLLSELRSDEPVIQHVQPTKPKIKQIIRRAELRRAFTNARLQMLDKNKNHVITQKMLKEFCNLVWGYLDTQKKP